jgi:hypothetical protein
MPRIHFMSRSLHVLGLTTFTALLLAACGPAAPVVTPAGAPVASSCKDRSALGIKEVLAVVEQSLACTTDADCTVTPIGSACFDVCSRAVSVKALPAVKDAMSRVDATTCATYKQDGCRFDVPPCAPPTAARCVERACQ